jgi:Ca2+-binding EF-hand superfamily protein
MKEAVLSIIGCKLLKSEQYQAIKDIFRIMDKSGDGKLDAIEVTNLLNKLEVSNNGM